MDAVVVDEKGDVIRRYDSWDDLVAAESNGYVASVILRQGKKVWTWTTGPWPTKREGNNARNRLRTKVNKTKAEYPKVEVLGYSVTPAWKDTDRG